MTCPECRDTGIYTGFLVVEPCSRGCEPPRSWSEDDQRRQWDAYGEAAAKCDDVAPAGDHHTLDEAAILQRAWEMQTAEAKPVTVDTFRIDWDHPAFGMLRKPVTIDISAEAKKTKEQLSRSTDACLYAFKCHRRSMGIDISRQAMGAKRRHDAALNAWLCQQLSAAFPMAGFKDGMTFAEARDTLAPLQGRVRYEHSVWLKECRFFVRHDINSEWECMATISYGDLKP